MTDIIQKIDAALENEEKLMGGAVAKTMQEYNQNPTHANLKNYDSAKKGYEELKAKKQAESNKNIRFQNILEVVGYLKSQGWKIEKTKAYDDRILMRPQKDGTFLQSDVDKYAQGFLQKHDGSDLNGTFEEKTKQEIRLTSERADKVAFENQIARGMYVLRSDVESMFAGRASLLKSEAEAFFYNFMPQLCEFLSGIPEKIPDAIAFGLEKKDEWFHRYAEKLEFMAPAIKRDDEDAD